MTGLLPNPDRLARLAVDNPDNVTELVDAALKVGEPAALEALYTDGWKAGKAAAGRLLGELTKADPLTTLITGALKVMLSAATAAWAGIARSVGGELANTITRMLTEQATMQEIAKALRGVVGSRKRAEMIAVTEATRAMTAAAFDSYEEYGVEQVEFLATDDQHVCPYCIANEEQGPVPIGGTWKYGAPPVHPRCRCAVLPAVEELENLPEREPVDLTGWTDEELNAAIGEHADDESALEEILAELDRREDLEQGGDEAAQWQQFDELIASGVDEKEAYAEVFGKSVDRVQKDDAIARLRDAGYSGKGFDELARAAYRDALQRDYTAAEAATNGYLLTPAGQRKGLDPMELWRQTEAYARKWASDELKEWWDTHGRLTFDQFATQLLSGGTGGQQQRTGGESWLR